MSDSNFGGDGELRFRIEVMERASSQLAKDVKEGFETINRSFSALNDKVNTSGKPNWQITIAAASFCFVVITGFVTMIKGPADQAIAELKATTAMHSALIPQMLSKDDYMRERDRNYGIIEKRNDAQDRRLESFEDRFENYRSRHEH